MFEYIAPCHFGLESVLRREVLALGYDITGVEDGKVYFAGDADAGILANLSLRTAERRCPKTHPCVPASKARCTVLRISSP